MNEKYVNWKLNGKRLNEKKTKLNSKSLNQEIANLSEQRNKLKAKWQAEKEIAEQIQKKKNEIEQLKFEDEDANRKGELGTRCRNPLWTEFLKPPKLSRALKQKLSDVQKDSAAD